MIFSVCIPSYNRYSANNISIGLHNSFINQQNFNTISIERIIVTIADCINTTNHWFNYEVVFEANGNEEFLYFGNFNEDSSTNACLLDSNRPEGDTFALIDNIVLTEFHIEIPNVFTPNNDGINDKIFLDSNLNQFSIQIMNRWGNFILDINSEIGWDGEDNNDNKLPEGVYFFIISERKTNKIIQTGYIHLLR